MEYFKSGFFSYKNKKDAKEKNPNAVSGAKPQTSLAFFFVRSKRRREASLGLGPRYGDTQFVSHSIYINQRLRGLCVENKKDAKEKSFAPNKCNIP